MFIETCIFAGWFYLGSKLYKKINKKSNLEVNRMEISPAKYNGSPPEQTNQLSNDKVDNHLAVTSVSTGLIAIGKLSYPPLIPVGILGLAYPLYGMLKRAYEGLYKEHKVKIEVISSILIPGLIFKGYYFTASFSSWLYYLGLKLLKRIENNTRDSLIGIFENQPRSVWIVKDGIEVELPFDLLKTGDIAAVNAGETVPADGIITEGVATIDQQILTGESQPLEKGVGKPVFASTVVLAGKIRIRVEKSGKETVVANVADMLKQTVDFKSTIQSTGEEIADKTVLPTMVLGAATLPVFGPVGALAVLNSYIGTDIRITAPLSTLSFLKVASQNGILIKDGRALEQLAKADTVVFDKTGTLTLEQPQVQKIHPCDGYEEREILKYAAIAESRQSHPIARAILKKADEYGWHPGEIDDAEYEIGYGIRVRIGDALIRVGSARFMEMEGIRFSENTINLLNLCLEGGHSLVMVAKDEHLAGSIELNTAVRPEVRNIIHRLRKRKKEMYMITGDHEKPARMLAGELEIDNYFAETFPEQKAQIIEQLQKDGRIVCFIGDGINDSIAMKKANVSLSLKGASTAATDTAGIIMMDGTLSRLDMLFEIAEDFDKNINFAFTTAIAPGIINIGGVFLFQTGIYFSMILFFVSLPMGVINAFLPIFKYRNPELKSIK